MNNETLKGCPFCGELPDIQYKRDACWWIECENWNCARPTSTVFATKEKAIEAWNQRAKQAPPSEDTKRLDWLDAKCFTNREGEREIHYDFRGSLREAIDAAMARDDAGKGTNALPQGTPREFSQEGESAAPPSTTTKEECVAAVHEGTALSKGYSIDSRSEHWTAKCARCGIGLHRYIHDNGHDSGWQHDREKKEPLSDNVEAVQKAREALERLYKTANQSLSEYGSGRTLWATFVRDTAWKGLEGLLSSHVTDSDSASGSQKFVCPECGLIGCHRLNCSRYDSSPVTTKDKSKEQSL